MNLNGDLFIDVMNLLGNSWNVTKEDLVTYSPCIQQAAMAQAALVGTGWYEAAVFAENGLCRFVHRISSFLPETYVIIVFILTYRDGDRDRD